jgi:hypothetical protein
MPIISIFYGIIVRMNFGDHLPCHFHAEYQGFKAAFDIKTGKLIAGELPKNAERLVSAWAKKHKAMLLANWKKAQQLEPLDRIPGEE